LLLLACALALSACAGANRNREVRDPRPENYKADILAMLHVYLRDPTQIRDAAASEPTPVLVGTTNRYVVCLRFNAKKSSGEYGGLKQYLAIFVAGRLDQMVEAKPEQCAAAAEAVDILQIPAFLCRQTDLLLAAGATGKAINIKKGQFLAPSDMKNTADKIASTGNERILLCERGASFGYNTLVVDMRALPIMAQTGYPVVFDATHSVAEPGALGDRSGGEREFAPILARAAVAAGVAAVFVETHQDPDNANTAESATMLPLEMLPELFKTLIAFDRLAKGRVNAMT